MEFLLEEGRGAGKVVRELGHRRRSSRGEGLTRLQAGGKGQKKEPSETAGEMGRPGGIKRGPLLGK